MGTEEVSMSGKQYDLAPISRPPYTLRPILINAPFSRRQYS